MAFTGNKTTGGQANIYNYTDYYPYGLVAQQTVTGSYRYAYQGAYAESDAATGYDNFKLRMYDARIGRWLTTDPKGQFASPYEGMGNDPVTGYDLDGGGTFDWYLPIGDKNYMDAVWFDGSKQIAGYQYLGKSFYGVDESTGNVEYFRPNGHKEESPWGLDEVQVKATRKVNYDRMPDYINFNISIAIPNPVTLTFVGWNGTASLDRYGTVHWSPIGFTIGKSTTLVSASLTANWIAQRNKPSQQQLNGFLTGSGYNYAGGFWRGGGVSFSPDGTEAWSVGIYTPQIGESYNYTPNKPYTWYTSIGF